MSDYTPTMSEIRAHYSGGARMRKAVEFDRWLAAHDREVRADERETCARKIESLTDEGVDFTVGRMHDPLPSDWRAVGINEGMTRAASLVREGGQK